jgi:iron complex outermembrane receptor protein
VRRFAAVATALLACAARAAFAAAESPAARDLEFFALEAEVVTASRRPEPAAESPVAVEVVTAEDIRRSGALNLWDFLRFRVGMTVVEGRSGEGNRALVSVRGFPAEFVDKLLVLLDGRSVYTGLSGGAVWEHIPVQVQDIERIEIVRGPNAALYGSNAGLGVVNIITRRPSGREAAGGLLAGNRSIRRADGSIEDSVGPLSYRLSASQRVQDGHPSAGAPGTGNDFLHSNKLNFRGSWEPAPGIGVELFGGGYRDTLGVVDAANPQGRFTHHFGMVRSQWERAPGSVVEAVFARRDDLRRFDPIFNGPVAVREYQYDSEVNHRLESFGGRLKTVYGGSLRHTEIESAGLFAGRPRQHNAIRRAFLSPTLKLSPAVSALAAVSLERSDTGGTEEGYTLAAVFSPARRHAFRLRHALAPTIPTLYQKAADQRATATVRLVGNPGIRAQRLRSYEAGYQGAFQDGRLEVGGDVFYMQLDDLSQTVVRSYVFPQLTLSFDNGNKAVARGAELKAGYRWSAVRSLKANYTYETVSDAKAQTNVRKGTPAHSLNILAETDLGRGFSASSAAGYRDGRSLYSQATGRTLDLPADWRLDARLAFTPREGVEVFVAGQNLGQPRRVEFPDGLQTPRTFLGGVTVRFAR